jgi:hypothetical protein
MSSGFGQRFEAGDDVEQFFVDGALAQSMKGQAQFFEQLVDVGFGALHRRQSAQDGKAPI